MDGDTTTMKSEAGAISLFFSDIKIYRQQADVLSACLPKKLMTSTLN
jgi:hypothetical protein